VDAVERRIYNLKCILFTEYSQFLLFNHWSILRYNTSKNVAILQWPQKPIGLHRKKQLLRIYKRKVVIACKNIVSATSIHLSLIEMTNRPDARAKINCQF
jgi:hypothetical protein